MQEPVVQDGTITGWKVWDEAGFTISVTQDPPQFAKISYGLGAEIVGGSKKDLRRLQSLVHRELQKGLDERVEEASEYALEVQRRIKERQEELIEHEVWED